MYISLCNSSAMHTHAGKETSISKFGLSKSHEEFYDRSIE